jgi:phytoene synthase
MQPRSPDRADLAACRALLRGGSRTFFAASFLLPRRVREPASALYAFCRLADDAVDLAAGAPAIDALRERLARIYDGRPSPIAADRAFADVVAAFDIPRALPEALLEGFEWDAAGRRYETPGELAAYAARVAGTVGAMMALVMGARSPDQVARASDLGVAMQLSNIARDVGEDARAGRLYLPLAWLREAGIDPEAWLARPVFTGPLGGVVQRLLREAERLYERAGAGVAALPLDCRPGINAARTLYAEIGREVERHGFDSVARRAVVPGARKARLLVRAIAAGIGAARGPSAPPLPETRFLVEAVASAPPHASGPAAIAWWNLYDRIVRVIDLFERLERRERALRTGGRA